MFISQYGELKQGFSDWRWNSTRQVLRLECWEVELVMHWEKLLTSLVVFLPAHVILNCANLFHHCDDEQGFRAIKQVFGVFAKMATSGLAIPNSLCWAFLSPAYGFPINHQLCCLYSTWRCWCNAGYVERKFEYICSIHWFNKVPVVDFFKPVMQSALHVCLHSDIHVLYI